MLIWIVTLMFAIFWKLSSTGNRKVVGETEIMTATDWSIVPTSFDRWYILAPIRQDLNPALKQPTLEEADTQSQPFQNQQALDSSSSSLQYGSQSVETIISLNEMLEPAGTSSHFEFSPYKGHPAATNRAHFRKNGPIPTINISIFSWRELSLYNAKFGRL